MSIRRGINILLAAIVTACCLCGHMAISGELRLYMASGHTGPATAPTTRPATVVDQRP